MPNLARLFFFLLLFSPLIGCSPASSEIAEKAPGEKVHFTDLAQATEPAYSLIRSQYRFDIKADISFAFVDLNNDSIVEALVLSGTEKSCAQTGCSLTLYFFDDGALVNMENIYGVQEVWLGSHYSEEYRDLILKVEDHMKTQDKNPVAWQWHQNGRVYCSNCFEGGGVKM